MNRETVHKIAEQVFSECRTLLGAGQKEYAGGDNALGNFERLAAELRLHASRVVELADELGISPEAVQRVAEEAGLTREKVLWVYATKHRDGVASWINGHRSQREPVTGRINDLIVYLVLLRAMHDEAAALAGKHEPGEGDRLFCPDGATCAHRCGTGGCHRVINDCAPAPGAYPGHPDEWPHEVVDEERSRVPGLFGVEAGAVQAEATQRRLCPDGGTCHHACEGGCYRVFNCGPLSGAYPDQLEGDWPVVVERDERKRELARRAREGKPG